LPTFLCQLSDGINIVKRGATNGSVGDVGGYTHARNSRQRNRGRGIFLSFLNPKKFIPLPTFLCQLADGINVVKRGMENGSVGDVRGYAHARNSRQRNRGRGIFLSFLNPKNSIPLPAFLCQLADGINVVKRGATNGSVGNVSGYAHARNSRQRNRGRGIFLSFLNPKNSIPLPAFLCQLADGINVVKRGMENGSVGDVRGYTHARNSRQRNRGRGIWSRGIFLSFFKFKNSIPLPAFLCLIASMLCSQAEETTPELPEKNFPFLNKYCLECHDSLSEKGKVNLEEIPFKVTTLEEAELWQKVLNSMNSGEMPPEDEKQPENQEKADFLDALAQTMVDARRSLSDSGGKITMRRLNRREYQNTIDYLTGVNVDASNLPSDGGSGSFDTVGASQFISSDQIEQYLKLGRSAIDELFERQAALKEEARVFRVEPETTVNVQSLEEMVAMEEVQERYLLWKAGVDKAALAPENQEVLEQIREKHNLTDLTDSVRLYQNANLLKGVPDAKGFGFRDANAASFSFQGGYDRTHAYRKHYLELPHSDRGTYLKLAWAIQRIDVTPKPEDLPPGTYKLRIRAGAVEGSPSSRHFIEVGHPQRVNGVLAGFSSLPLSSHQVTSTVDSPEIIETTIEIGVNTPREFGIQERRPTNRKSVVRDFFRDKSENGYGTPPAIWVDWIELEGPHAAAPKTWKQRREVEAHANAQVGGTYNGYLKGGHKQATAFLKTGKRQKGIKDELEAKFRIKAFEQNGPSYRRYLDDPLTQTGSYLTIYNVNKTEFIALPPEHPSGWKKTKHVAETLPPGDYKLRFRIGAVKGSPAERHFVDLGAVPEKEHFDHLATFQVTGSTDEPQVIALPVTLTKDGPRKFALREKRDPKADLARYRAAREETGVGPVPALWIDWVEWEGPLASSRGESGQGNWWVSSEADSDESSRARKILVQFARRAFRGVLPENEFIDRLSVIFETRRTAGDAFDVAIRTPLSVILASPGFLYLNEPSDVSPSDDSPTDESERRELTDRELAVRLSYFLWSAPPDGELLALAERNELSHPDVLRQQVDRLIADPRSDGFVSGFVHQWLDMERLDFFQFDVTLHREFDESTRSAAREEVYQSFAHLLRDPEEGRIGKLLKSDTVFINGLLATYYGIDGVTGDDFQQVALPADSPRGGLLGMAAIHAMGSDGVESSPVERGTWVLRHLLNDPPPPAPPNVPQLSRLADEPLNTRQKLAAHMEEAQCASCHRKIDPIGFGLENFDAAGKWRTEEHHDKKTKWEIDPAGAFHNGPEFADYFEMRDLIADREGDFAHGFAEHLIAYSLGRPFGFTDVDLADEIVTAAKAEDYSISEFIQALVLSEPFQKK